MESHTDQIEPLTKKQAKKASKRRKLEALLRIAALNDQDRQARMSHEDTPLANDNHKEPNNILEESCNSNSIHNRVDLSEICSTNDEPSPKRHKPDTTTIDDEEMPLYNEVSTHASCNSGPSEQFYSSPNKIFPQPTQPQLINSGPTFPLCPTFIQQNITLNVPKPQPISRHFLDNLTALQFMPALLVPEVRNVILRNSSSQNNGCVFNPAPLTLLPSVFGGYPNALPPPNIRISNFPNRNMHRNGNIPLTEKLDVDQQDEDLKNLRKSLKARYREFRATPHFYLSAIGEAASLSTPEDDRIPIFPADLQRLILKASLLGNNRVALRCGNFKHSSKIAGVKLLLLEGLSLQDVQKNPELFELSKDIFPAQMECIMPTAYQGALLEELAAVPLTTEDRTNLINRYGSLEAALQHTSQIFRVLRAFFPIKDKVSQSEDKLKPAGEDQSMASAGSSKELEKSNPDIEMSFSHTTDKFPRTLLLLSAWQMIEEGYPLPLKGNFFKQYEHFSMSRSEYGEVTPQSPMYGLDCEMCLTTLKKHELTRVSILNEKHEVVYDTLVMPPNKIINYLTEFSGITKEMMKNVTTTLEQVQEKIREILEPDAILVGQSLNSDLLALKLMHPYVIDTSIIFNLTGDRCRKSKLKYLAKAFLQLDIQHDSVAGHDPLEDAGTALQLVQHKLAKSLEFGDAVLSQLRNCPFSIPETMDPVPSGGKKVAPKKKPVHDDSIVCSLFRYLNQQTVNIVGDPDIIEEYHKYTYLNNKWGLERTQKHKRNRPNIVRGNDELDILDKAVRCMDQSFFTIAHFQLETPVSELITMRHEETTERFKTIISDFNRAAPENSLVVLVLGGNSEGANGAVYVGIRKRKFTQTCKLPNRGD